MRFSALDGLRIGVWGTGVETRSFGRHVATSLPRARIAVLVLEQRGDARGASDAGAVADAPELTADAVQVGASEAVEALAGCDVLVRSPGVSVHRPELRALAARGLPIATPTGLWMAERGGRNVIGVTATKGKSTTASLVAHLVRATGAPAHLAGNIGVPALDLLGADERELAVIELSSYQIADLAVGPESALASNLYPEHLTWHGSFEAYRSDKLRLLGLPGVRRCIVNATSPEVMAAPRAGATWAFGTPEGWHVEGEEAVARDGSVMVRAGETPLLGPHNALNLCAAATALEAMEIPVPPLAEALADFVPLAHRLQIVHRSGEDVLWVDDSIATEPYAARFAIESFPRRPIVLIGGGYDRGQDYAALGALLAARDAVVLGLPATGARLVEAARAAGVPEARARIVPDLPAAVAAARAAVRPGAVVLLSPAAPSFTTHTSYAVRGDHFRDLAREG
jgi:UDP-N-acetylmuramoyl-L-alanine---L-glutamate ligase